jgi:hypothetical protein
MFVDLQYGSLSDEAVVHFADTVQKGKILVLRALKMLFLQLPKL